MRGCLLVLYKNRELSDYQMFRIISICSEWCCWEKYFESDFLNLYFAAHKLFTSFKSFSSFNVDSSTTERPCPCESLKQFSNISELS